MPATGNEPVKLSQLKSVVPGIALRKFDFTITNIKTPVQLPFATEWGILLDALGTYTMFFVDYGNTVQLLSIISPKQVIANIYILYKGTRKEMCEKLAHNDVTVGYTSAFYKTYNGSAVDSIRQTIDVSKYPGVFNAQLQINDRSTLYVHWPCLFINFFFEK